MISITALYNYDPTIFDAIDPPAGLSAEGIKAAILLNNAELPLVYTDPATIKFMIEYWANSSFYSWEKLANTLTLEYNPIWNKDGKITETETLTGSGSGIDKVSAFDSSDFENRGKSESESETSREYERVEQGNIGVTSSQQLIKEEREIARYNIYDEIAKDFRHKFCVMVY